MHKYLFLFILVCLMAVRAGAQEKKLCLQVGKRVVSIPVVLINDENEEGSSTSTHGLCDSFNSGRLRQSAGAQAAGQPEEYELNEVNSRLLPSGGEGGLQLSDQVVTNAAGSSGMGDCSVTIDRPTAGSEAATRPRVEFATGIRGASAWLQDVSPDEQLQEQEQEQQEQAPVYQIPESRLVEFSRLMFSLLSMSRDEQVRTLCPVARIGSYIFNSVVNRRWRYGRWIVPFIGLSTLSVGGTGLAVGKGGLAAAGFTLALLATPMSTWLTSYAPLNNEYEVSFSFNWDSPEVTWNQVVYLEQIIGILRRALQNDGDYDLIGATFRRDSQSQVLRFRVRTIVTVTEEGLRTSFDSQNQGHDGRFTINVQPFSE